jgi:hypothetical protein
MGQAARKSGITIESIKEAKPPSNIRLEAGDPGVRIRITKKVGPHKPGDELLVDSALADTWVREKEVAEVIEGDEVGGDGDGDRKEPKKQKGPGDHQDRKIGNPPRGPEKTRERSRRG